MIQVIIKYGRPVVLAVIKAAGSIPPISWIWGTATGSNWGTLSNRGWGIPTSATAPANITPPSITGTAVVDQTLTINGGTWSAVPYILRYDIYRDTTLITSIATSNSSINYTIPASFAGSNLKCTVSAINSAGSASADSNTVAILATLLDLYPNAAAAYSIRLLKGDRYNSALVRIRRSSDNAEQDVFVDTNYQLSLNSNITSRTSGTTLGTWIGSNSGFVVTWYDQSGVGSNMSSATPTRQPRIILNGALDTLNGKAVLKGLGTTTGMLSAYAPNSGTTNKQYLIVTNRGSQTTFCHLGSNTSADDYILIGTSGSTVAIVDRQVTVSNQRRNGATFTYSTRGDVYTALANQSILTSNVVFNFLDNVLAIGYRHSNQVSGMPDMQEIIIFTDQANVSGKETNANNFYGAF